MRVAYLIIAHADPEMLEHLVRAIDPTKRDIYIHIDLKTDINIFNAELLAQVKIIEPRIPVYWGNSSVTAASMRLIKEAYSCNYYDYFHIISGADFPVRPLSEFESFLDKSQPLSFLYSESANNKPEALKRLRSPYFISDRTHLSLLLQRIVFLFNHHVPFFRRRMLDNIEFRIGSNWFTIHRNVVPWIIDHWNDSRVRRFYYFTYLAEEIFFATALANSPLSHFYSTRSLRHMIWDGGAHPKTLKMDDIDDIRQTNEFFSRKFSSSISLPLIHAIKDDFLSKTDYLTPNKLPH